MDFKLFCGDISGTVTKTISKVGNPNSKDYIRLSYKYWIYQAIFMNVPEIRTCTYIRLYKGFYWIKQSINSDQVFDKL